MKFKELYDGLCSFFNFMKTLDEDVFEDRDDAMDRILMVLEDLETIESESAIDFDDEIEDYLENEEDDEDYEDDEKEVENEEDEDDKFTENIELKNENEK